MKPTLTRLWFWLTTTHRCAWCRRILHRRWIWMPKQRLECGIKIDWITDGFCAECFEKTTGVTLKHARTI